MIKYREIESKDRKKMVFLNKRLGLPEDHPEWVTYRFGFFYDKRYLFKEGLLILEACYSMGCEDYDMDGRGIA